MRRMDASRRKALAIRLRHSQSLAILGQSSAAVEPSEGALHDPALGQYDKVLGLIGALDDRQLEPVADLAQARLEGRALIGAVGVEPQQDRVEAEQGGHDPDAGAVLHAGWMNQDVHQQALCVDEDVALPTLDRLARVTARRVDRGPPFSAPLTLWLSRMAAVGLAWRPACSRQAMNSVWWIRSSVPS